MGDYTRTAQALAHNIDDPPPGPRRSQSSSPVFHRRSLSSARRPANAHFDNDFLNGLYEAAMRTKKQFLRLSPLKRLLLVIAGSIVSISTLLFVIYNERIFGALVPVAKEWRKMSGGWFILFAATFLVSFPPMLGYSLCVTLAGFVFGVWKGWLIVASGTVMGSTASFIVSRTLLRGYVARLTANDTRFAALALTLKHDGLKLLIMIRLCPLPYSLSNGAISTIPTVKWYQFMAAGAIASPKLILHVFVGSQLGVIAESGDKMDTRTRIISYISVAIGMAAGVGTGFWMYSKTQNRARELEAEEREAAIRGGEGDDEYAEEPRYRYSDDPERDTEGSLGLDADDYSMHTTRADYHDSSSSGEEDALTENPFGRGDEERGFRGLTLK